MNLISVYIVLLCLVITNNIYGFLCVPTKRFNCKLLMVTASEDFNPRLEAGVSEPMGFFDPLSLCMCMHTTSQ